MTKVLLILLFVFVIAPPAFYMVVKFGAAGYYRAKQLAKQKEEHEIEIRTKKT